MLSFIFYFHKKLKTKYGSLFVFHFHGELKNKLLNEIKIDFMVNSGVDKLLSRRPTFQAHNFTCAPDRASNKMDAQKQSSHLVETQLETLLFVFYYLNFNSTNSFQVFTTRLL